MCLLVVLSRVLSEAPLLVAANRDERMDRRALPMTVLESGPPQVLGGRDELAGGTWLAVNGAGVIAGLTNRPVVGGRDPSKRSRGELPLLAAAETSASDAVAALAAVVDPAAFNPAWMLVGDRTSLYAVEVADGPALTVSKLAPGLHVLENRPLGAPSPKVRRVQALLEDAGGADLEGSRRLLASVLADHARPSPLPGDPDEEWERPAAFRSACVHTDGYGTRWSALVSVGTEPGLPPDVRYADGTPCVTPFRSASPLWEGNSAS